MSTLKNTIYSFRARYREIVNNVQSFIIDLTNLLFLSRRYILDSIYIFYNSIVMNCRSYD